MARITAVDLLRGKNMVRRVRAVLLVEHDLERTSVGVKTRRKTGRFLHFER